MMPHNHALWNNAAGLDGLMFPRSNSMLWKTDDAMANLIRQHHSDLTHENNNTILSKNLQASISQIKQNDPPTRNDSNKGRHLSDTTSTITCTEIGPSSFRCYNSSEAISFDKNMMPLQPIRQCDTNEFTDESWATNKGCSNTCIMYSPNIDDDASTFDHVCQACAWLDNGEYVYDCRNLHPQAQCPSRNSDGLCQEYEHWRCYKSPVFAGYGYICLPVNLDVLNSAFLSDEVELREAETWLYCTNDNTGKSAQDCDNPACQIFTNAAEGEGCQSCQMALAPKAFTTTITVVIPSGGAGNNRRMTEETPLFSYDCSEVLPNLTCPILLANGTCSNVPELQIRNYTYENVPSFVLSERNDDDDENTNGIGWTLDFIDPTTFNVIIDVYDKIVMIMFGMAVALLFPVFMSWQVRSQKRVPVSTLGRVPDNFWSAFKGLFLWRLSIPVMVLVVLVTASDFAHSVADAGLDFVIVKEKGPNKTALILGTDPEIRNNNTPIEVLGDPLNMRTFVYSQHLQENNIQKSLPETKLLDRYLSAVKLIARGESPFTRNNKKAWLSVGTDYGGLDSQAQTEGNGFLSTYGGSDDSALIEMDSEIPLQCYDMELAELGRFSLGIEPFGRDMATIAAVPNCILTTERISGIFEKQPVVPQIIEDLELRSLSFYSYLLENIWLLQDTERFHSFRASSKSKELARDRRDWRDGRLFYDIDGIQIGSEIIQFSSVSLGSGADENIAGLGPSVQAQASFEGENLYEYALFGVVDGDCPKRASGLQSDAEDCLVKILLACDRFPEDTATRVHDIYAPQTESTTCALSSLRIIWVRNFKVDTRVAAVTAGLYGIIKPSLWGNNVGKFDRNGILAALFALGNLDERPSVDEVIRPRINIVFLIFIALPFAFSLVFLMIAMVFHKTKLKVPETAWEFMVYGAEQNLFMPKREGPEEPFPPLDSRIMFQPSHPEDDRNEIKEILDKVTTLETTPDHIFVFQGEGSNEINIESQEEIDPWQQWNRYLHAEEDPLPPGDLGDQEGNGGVELSGHTVTEYTA